MFNDYRDGEPKYRPVLISITDSVLYDLKLEQQKTNKLLEKLIQILTDSGEPIVEPPRD